MNNRSLVKKVKNSDYVLGLTPGRFLLKEKWIKILPGIGAACVYGITLGWDVVSIACETAGVSFACEDVVAKVTGVKPSAGEGGTAPNKVEVVRSDLL